MKLDVLITTAHPDDAEAAMGGTILKLIKAGKKVGIADFTQGELGSRGNAEIRCLEAKEADKRLGLTTRVNLGLPDGFFRADDDSVLKVLQIIRQYQPETIFSNPISDRHPDHGRANLILREAAFLSGLSKIVTHDQNGNPQEPWRPHRIFHYIQSNHHDPDFIVDISDYWEQKCHVMRAYQTQFHCETYSTTDPETSISGKDFWINFEARARVTGNTIGVKYGEGFLSEVPLAIHDISVLT